MGPAAEQVAHIALIGIGATAVMDLWLLILKRLNVPTLNFAFIGRWIGHLARGKWAHEAIAKASPVKGELALGWLTHYAIGIAFAVVLVGLYGMGWTQAPSLLPALGVGVATVAVPLFVMQPAMGAGLASSRTKTPLMNVLRSLANHTVFGAGLYIAAVSIEWISR